MNSFLRKVEAERSVLSIVNKYTKGKEQLTGLSGLAISKWCSINSVSEDNSVPKSLHILGDLCNSLSDRSNESFVKIPTERICKIKGEELILNDALVILFKDRLTNSSSGTFRRFTMFCKERKNRAPSESP